MKKIIFLMILIPFASFCQPPSPDSKAVKEQASLQYSNSNKGDISTIEKHNDLGPNEIFYYNHEADFDKAVDRYYTNKYLSGNEYIVCKMLLIFASVLCLIEGFLFLFRRINSSQLVKLFILTLIIFAVLFLIAAGYNNDQISPAIGLLGTIAGYLIGKSSAEIQSEDQHK